MDNDESLAAQGPSENPAAQQNTSTGQEAARGKPTETPRGCQPSRTVRRTPKRRSNAASSPPPSRASAASSASSYTSAQRSIPEMRKWTVVTLRLALENADIPFSRKANKAELYNLYTSSQPGVSTNAPTTKPKAADKTRSTTIPQHQEASTSTAARKRCRSPSRQGRPSASLGHAPGHAVTSNQSAAGSPESSNSDDSTPIHHRLGSARTRPPAATLPTLSNYPPSHFHSVLGQLAQIYVETISSGKVPCLDNAVVALANLENKAAVQKALKVCQSGREEVMNKFPVSMENITSVHQKSSSLATSEFLKRSFKDEKGEYIANLKENIDMYYTNLLNQNETASKRKCKELLKDLFSDMNERLQNGEYSQCGGHEIYCRHRDAIIAQYRREPNKGVKAEAVLNEFLNDRAAEANSILHTDMKLTENEKKIQEWKEKEDLLQQKCKEEEEKRIESKRMMEVEQERQKHTIKQMKENFDKEMEQRREEMDRAMESKLKEQEELLSKGFKEKADELH
ncbi:Guanylate-binding protein 4 [Triplophysa tibetana]|uniref:Guanylate-binding protein 4 n=1 Tax=Triplophysa tibetana TaxID=1572043 RepID=A0A5A9PAU1_9TELE|nr:Guanylate-binding protein 4 [Triplophysa tibetana]